jgi:hypothetical protein
MHRQGVSGRAHYVTSKTYTNAVAVREGWINLECSIRSDLGYPAAQRRLSFQSE